MAMRKHGSTGYVHIPQQDAPSQEEIATSISPSLNATDPEIISKDIHIASPDYRVATAASTIPYSVVAAHSHPKTSITTPHLCALPCGRV